jgi:membrane complex biogenesis BtpA family protein
MAGKTMTFKDVFGRKKPLIACVHLLPLPGAPRFSGDMRAVYDAALDEADIFKRQGVDGLIVENFRDKPFYPGRVPAETVAALAAVTREIVRATGLPVGVNALRNDALSAIAIAAAAEAHFIRVNVHMGAVVSEQGVIQGASHETLRLRAALRSKALIFADVGVKHAAPLADRGLPAETKDLTERGMADAVIVSGELTGAETRPEDVDIVAAHTHLPILIGSGTTPENLSKVFAKAHGFIVGSYFKKGGRGENRVEAKRVKAFMQKLKSLSGARRKRDM